MKSVDEGFIELGTIGPHILWDIRPITGDTKELQHALAMPITNARQRLVGVISKYYSTVK